MSILTPKYTLYIRVSVTSAGIKIINKCTHYYEGAINFFWRFEKNIQS